MILSAVYVLVFAQSSSEVPEGLMNNSVFPLQYQHLLYQMHTGITKPVVVIVSTAAS